MRGMSVVVNVTDVERKALDTFREAILAANSVEQWATQLEGQPYWFATEALKAALRELFTEDIAEHIYEMVIESGESVSYCIDHYFAHEYGTE